METNTAMRGSVPAGFINMGVFIGQGADFMNFVSGLAVATDQARRGVS